MRINENWSQQEKCQRWPERNLLTSKPTKGSKKKRISKELTPSTQMQTNQQKKSILDDPKQQRFLKKWGQYTRSPNPTQTTNTNIECDSLRGHCRQSTKRSDYQADTNWIEIRARNWQHQCQCCATPAHIQSFGIRAAKVTVDCGTVHNTRLFNAGFGVPLSSISQLDVTWTVALVGLGILLSHILLPLLFPGTETKML